MSSDQPRRLTDPKAMRAVAHPTRWALLEALARQEPLTATEAAEIVGESPTNCAFHLRTLAKYGFVEETGDGQGRRRPWKRSHIGLTFDATDSGNPAADLLSTHLWTTWLEKLNRINVMRPAFDEHRRIQTEATQTVFHVTPDELAELQRELAAFTLRYRERVVDPSARPPGSEPVEFIGFTYPRQAIEP
ncbi:ArsR family transcriptional regulator [Pseudonocardiaceae bacterium YIM PH 21723]|nr:ArsR family transcriptional regulator [Pseudonocardiaceae bacterium YIM PH 21723]